MEIIDKSEIRPNTIFSNLKNGDIFRAVDSNRVSSLYMKISGGAVSLYTFEIDEDFGAHQPVTLLDTELIINGMGEIDDFTDYDDFGT